MLNLCGAFLLMLGLAEGREGGGRERDLYFGHLGSNLFWAVFSGKATELGILCSSLPWEGHVTVLGLLFHLFNGESSSHPTKLRRQR